MAVGQEGSGLQAVGLAQSWLPAHATKNTLQGQPVAETLIWPEHCLAAEQSGSVPLPNLCPCND